MAAFEVNHQLLWRVSFGSSFPCGRTVLAAFEINTDPCGGKALEAFETNTSCGLMALAAFETNTYCCGGTVLMAFEVNTLLLWRDGVGSSILF